ncbi:MAG TPA: tetratricopeptide repeat protein, partial [Elusimicrobiota bacterium]|nr:tetratricopeptide repeat protein [Elusimicrobiota bacterium]
LASEGWALLERRRYDEGIAAVSRAAALEPGRAWEHAGWPRDARDGGARSLRLRALAGLKARSGPVVHYFRARILRGLGREDEALSELEKARPLFKSCTWALECAAGELLVEIGRLGAARASFERAAALNPRHARARAWRGEVLYWLGRAQAAAREFDAAVRAEPEAAWAHAWRGQFLLWTGRYGEARRALDRALALDPRNAWARAWRGAAEALAGDPKEGLRDIETAIRLDPGDVEARIWRGELLARAGRTAEALRELSVARRRGPDRPWLYAVSAWARGLRGDERGMNRELAEARRLAPEVFAAAADVAGLERIFAAAKGNRTYRRLG